MARIFLILGGARSGKSQFAEDICLESGKRVGYIATSEVRDEEMARRVDLHRTRRPDAWKTWECPDGDTAVLQAAQKESDILLFDCLTLYLTYWIFHPEAPIEPSQREAFVLEKLAQMLKAFEQWNETLLIVSNDVGGGIVPAEAISREFRDLAGKANQMVAKMSEETYLVSCGYGVPIKKLATLPGEVLGS